MLSAGCLGNDYGIDTPNIFVLTHKLVNAFTWIHIPCTTIRYSYINNVAAEALRAFYCRSDESSSKRAKGSSENHTFQDAPTTHTSTHIFEQVYPTRYLFQRTNQARESAKQQTSLILLQDKKSAPLFFGRLPLAK